eukprot:2736225-Prymnesium_polylepis.1
MTTGFRRRRSLGRSPWPVTVTEVEGRTTCGDARASLAKAIPQRAKNACERQRGASQGRARKRGPESRAGVWYECGGVLFSGGSVAECVRDHFDSLDCKECCAAGPV